MDTDTTPNDGFSSFSPTLSEIQQLPSFMAWRDCNRLEQPSPTSSTVTEMPEPPSPMSLGDITPSDAVSSNSATLPKIQDFPNSYAGSLFDPTITQEYLQMLFPADNDVSEASGSTRADIRHLDPLQEDLVESLTRNSVSTPPSNKRSLKRPLSCSALPRGSTQMEENANKFWSSVKPYCADVPRNVSFLDDLVQECSQDVVSECTKRPMPKRARRRLSFEYVPVDENVEFVAEMDIDDNKQKRNASAAYSNEIQKELNSTKATLQELSKENVSWLTELRDKFKKSVERNRIKEALENTDNQMVHSTQPGNGTRCEENLKKYDEEALLLLKKQQISTKQLDKCTRPDKPI